MADYTPTSNTPTGTTTTGPYVERRTEVDFFTRLRRISWGAVFAGLVVTLMVHILLSLLGMSIGFAAVDPATDNASAQNFFTGSAIYMGISGLISLFCGGWVAARFSGYAGTTEGLMHGFLTWGVATIASVFLLTSAVGGLFGVTTELIGQTTTAAAAASEPGEPGGLEDTEVAQNVEEEAEELAATARQRVQELQEEPGVALQRVSEGAAQAALWGFIALLLGACAAMLGGWAGKLKGEYAGYTETRTV
jgi:hypothetical protein